jgi:hypothetical protein
LHGMAKGAFLTEIGGRGLPSPTFQLNLSRF